MAVRDIEAFLRERAVAFDSTLDVSAGSPFDKQVIQPTIRRYGTDPFTVDLETFVLTRLQQAYPDMAIGEGDAFTDGLVQPVQLLWDAIVREIDRVKKGMSFKNPEQLTVAEAEALGANLFAERPKGDSARGIGRVYFAQAQTITVTPVNFFTSKSGLLFYPTESQAIRTEEMLLNDAGDGTYYFDVNVIAEKAGSDYNIGPDELASIANISAAVRVTNQRRFQDGLDAATAAEFVDSAKQQLTEKSMVTLRGISAKVTNAFPEVTRLNSIGFNEPEMQRDILRGGGLGPALVGGTLGSTVADSLLQTGTTRLVAQDLGVDFTQVIGPVGAATGKFVLTVIGAALSGAPASDLNIVRVISASTLEVDDPSLVVGRTGLSWTVRKRELTLSGIPGGILFPNNAEGTLTVPDDELHIGGAFDVYVRGTATDETTLVIDSLADDEPELAGSGLAFDSSNLMRGTLTDFTFGINYAYRDETFTTLEKAATDGLSLQVLDGPNAGIYRVLQVVQQDNQTPRITVSPSFVTASTPPARWRLFDVINVSLTDIKDTRVTGGDLITAQNSNIVKTAGGTDFDSLAVAKGDILRIFTGVDKGDYTVTEAPLIPTFQQLRIDARLTASQSNVRYTVFRPNLAGNMQPPLLRVKSVQLLDSSNQPLGTTVPYAKPIDVQSRAFQNPSRGVKYTTTLRLGLLSRGLGFSQLFLDIGDKTLLLHVGDASVGELTVSVTFSASPANKTPQMVVDEINAAIAALTGEVEVAVLTYFGGSTYVGIRPFGPTGFVETLPSGSATTAFFGDAGSYTTNDMRQLTSTSTTAWRASPPGIDFATGLDVFQVTTGTQAGSIVGPYLVGNQPAGEVAFTSNVAVLPARKDHPFAPEVGVTALVGARSIGSARMYFLEPTSVEVRSNETFFGVQTANGLLRFTPDPTLAHQRIPALPEGAKPHDGVGGLGSIFRSASQDFVLSGVQAGDRLILDFRRIQGSVALPDPVPNLVHKTFKFSLDGSAPKTLVFLRDDTSLSITDVSREGVVKQINAAAGIPLVRLTSSNRLEFDVEVPLTIYKDGTANQQILYYDSSVPTVPFFTEVDVTNASLLRSTDPAGYVIAVVNPSGTNVGELQIEGAFTFGLELQAQQFRVMQPGVQRVSTGTMATQQAEAGLYYADVELVSEGVGDAYNVDAGLQFRVTGERADGYYLTVEDPNFTFSPLERPHLVLSKSILEVGVDDDPVNATQLLQQNIQVVYERSGLVDSVNSYALAETERVVCSSPLGRHLIPHYVRFDVNYVGGSAEQVTVPALENYVNNIAPVDPLESSDIQDVLSNHGATGIDNPIDLIAVVHDVDRVVYAQRSQNRLYTGRLAAFIPDRLSVTRRVS